MVASETIFDSRVVLTAREIYWVEFVVGSRPCSEGFSLGSLVFLPPQNVIRIRGPRVCQL